MSCSDQSEIVETAKPKKNARITQKGGLEIVSRFLGRVEEANRQPFAYSIGAVVLFGSWDRNDKPHAGDIDIAVEFVPKAPPGEKFAKLCEQRLEAASEAGREIPPPRCYYWHLEEVAKFLKNRSKGISLVDLDQISQTMEPNDKPFSYTILRGDPETIAKMFARSRFGLKACRIRQRNPKSGVITTLQDDGTLNSC